MLKEVPGQSRRSNESARQAPAQESLSRVYSVDKNPHPGPLPFGNGEGEAKRVSGPPPISDRPPHAEPNSLAPF